MNAAYDHGPMKVFGASRLGPTLPLPSYHCMKLLNKLTCNLSLQLLTYHSRMALLAGFKHHHHHLHYASVLSSTLNSKFTFSIILPNPSHHSLPHLFRRISRTFMTISGLNCSSVFLLFCPFHLFL